MENNTLTPTTFSLGQLLTWTAQYVAQDKLLSTLPLEAQASVCQLLAARYVVEFGTAIPTERTES